jgi:trans-aconitate methyltransferase
MVVEPADLRDTRLAYDTVAVDYAALLGGELARKPLDRAVLAAFAELVDTANARGAVLEVGCGPGRVTAYLHDLGVNASGVDLSPAMIAEARRRHPHLTFDEGNLADLATADGVLAGVVAWYSIIHTPPERLPAVFAEFRRVLQPGGYLLLAFQVGDERVRLTHAYGHDLALDAYRLAPARTVELATNAGFALVARTIREPAEPEKRRHAYLIARAV